jgi:hypothetical protein
MMKDFFWHYFAQTGSIDAYLLYTENSDTLFPDEVIESENSSPVEEAPHMNR